MAVVNDHDEACPTKPGQRCKLDRSYVYHSAIKVTDLGLEHAQSRPVNSDPDSVAELAS